MSSIDITVRGAHTAYTPPERATVMLTIGIDAPEAAIASRNVASSADIVRRSIEPLHNPQSGPVTWWSSDQLRTWATRPWNKDGKVLPLVHHARVTFSVKFSDFAQLSTWLSTTVDVPGASIAGIDWALTAARREQLIGQVRRAAVQDAVAKAQAYADAVGAGTVRVVAIADAGMLGEGLHPTQAPSAKFARAVAADSGGPVEFTPEDIATAAEVDVRCLAG